jgi:hypothetical protein
VKDTSAKGSKKGKRQQARGKMVSKDVHLHLKSYQIKETLKLI